MIPHRAKLALAAASCCALASCLDARVNVPVSVIPIDVNQRAESMKRLRLRVYRAAPLLDEDHPQDARCSGEIVEPQTTDMEGKATFSLLPGDYEVCTEDQPYNGEKFKWSVPFRVAQDGLSVPQLVEDDVTYVGCARVEQRVRLLRWKYPAGNGGKANELLLTRDNAMDRTQTPPPAPTPCPVPTASPSAQPSPTAQASPTTQPSPTNTPATTASPTSTASPTTAASPAVSPTPATNPQRAPARVTGGSRRRRNRGL